MTVGILSLQGAFAEHAAVLNRLGIPSFEIRQKRDLNRQMDGLIIPGGESTVMNKLLRELDLYDTLLTQIQDGLPVFGTCAGLILLAKQVDGGESCFGTMDISVKRNAYGRQLGSFFTEDRFGSTAKVPMTFIRAPYIKSVEAGVEVLSIVDNNIVAARQKNMLVTAFHPELDDDLTVHQYFLQIIEQRNSQK